MELKAGELGFLAVLRDDERLGRASVVKNRAVVENREVISTCIRDRGGDLQAIDGGERTGSCLQKHVSIQRSLIRDPELIIRTHP